MYRSVQTVKVSVWDRYVGAVAFDSRANCYAFEYTPEFRRSGIELAPLTMPLSQAGAPFLFPDLPALTYYQLPALLADALPDSFGNSLIDAWMARQTIEKSRITPLDRLAYMAKRGMGALEFRPPHGPNKDQETALDLANLVDSARKALRGDFGADQKTLTALAQIIRVGTSAGGARAKATVAWNPKSGEIRSGQFDVPDGFEHWLLKLDGIGLDSELGTSQDYGRIEIAYHWMARAAGIEMADCRLQEENGRAHFMTRRFDRRGNEKLHLQTLCAMAHLDYRMRAAHDYSQLFLVLRRLGLGYDAREEAFRRLVFNVLAVNCDDHSKNFSFLLEGKGAWRLAPAYDLTHAFNPQGEWTNQHLMSVNGKFSGITRWDMLEVADRFGIGSAPAVIDRVESVIADWSLYAQRVRVAPAEIERVASSHRMARAALSND